MKNIHIVNGPNLHNIGTREPTIYGSFSFDVFFNQLKNDYKEKANLYLFQSHSEGAIIKHLYAIDNNSDGIILNAGAYTHYSYAIADAIRALKTAVVEVHISNVYSREDFRHKSVLSPYVKGVIAGFGLLSYKLALEYFLAI